MNEYNRNNGRTSLSVEELLEQVEGATMRHVKKQRGQHQRRTTDGIGRRFNIVLYNSGAKKQSYSGLQQ